MMFTIEQIKATHAKVKSGADFPNYVQDMKGLGVRSYDHFVTDGHCRYYGAGGFVLDGGAKWSPVEIAKESSAKDLQQALQIHQQGQTDYLTFCQQAAAAGVERWTVDMIGLTCIYHDLSGKKMISENIPLPSGKLAD